MPPQQWELLIRLIIGSLSCSYYLVLDEEWKRNPTDNIRAQIGISVESGGRHAGSLVNELLWFQVIRLFETYFSEQISIQLMCCEDVDTYIPDDDKAVQEEREERLKQFEKKQNILLSEAKSFIELQQLMRPS